MIELPTESEPVKVVCGDARDVFAALGDGSVDHVITDPPYAEKTHAGARTRVLTGDDSYANYAGAKTIVSFDSIGEPEFLELCALCVTVARRWVVMTCDWRHATAAEKRYPGEVVRVGVWVKPDGAPQFSGDRPGTGWEAVLMMHRKGRKRWNGGGHPAVWTCGVVKTGNVHPTQKPLALVRKWVRDFTDPGNLILDPFMGSGTTLVAALHEGRRAIGVEKDPRYCEIARQRIDEALGVGGLFADPPKQLSLFDEEPEPPSLQRTPPSCDTTGTDR